MSRFAQLLISLALVAAFAASAVTAFKCWECFPTKDKDCSEEKDRTQVECDASVAEPYCRKMIQNVENKVSYVLQCGGAESKMADGKTFKEYYNTANDYVKANVYHCKTDSCNSASDVGASKIAAVAIVALAWMLR